MTQLILRKFPWINIPITCSNSTLGDIIENDRSGVNVVGLKRPNGEYEINPGPETLLDADCKLFVLGTSEQIKSLNKMLKFAHV